jgi:hypothetical protein
MLTTTAKMSEDVGAVAACFFKCVGKDREAGKVKFALSRANERLKAM